MLLSAPIAAFGAFAGLYLRRFDFDGYGQIGLIILIDLAAKNAILIVQFARDEMAKGRDVIDAALEGAKRRLRPILMTSLAFILGCLPPMMASGSGAAGPQILGTVVVTGSAGGHRDRHSRDPGPGRLDTPGSTRRYVSP